MTRQLITTRVSKALLRKLRLRDALFLRDLNVEFERLQGTVGSIEGVHGSQPSRVPIGGDITQPDVIHEVINGMKTPVGIFDG